MNEEMQLAWLEISQMLGEPTREELDVFLRTWQRAIQATRKALAEQPAQQEPVAWKNAALRVGEDLCSVGPFGYYDMTAEQWLDWALSVVTVYAPPRTQPPAQRKPLPYNKDDMEGLDINQRLGFKLGWKSAEEAHGIKENT